MGVDVGSMSVGKALCGGVVLQLDKYYGITLVYAVNAWGKGNLSRRYEYGKKNAFG